MIEGVFLATCWGDRPPVAAFAAWQALCDVFVGAGQLGSAKRRSLLLNPVVHALQPPPLGSSTAIRQVPRKPCASASSAPA